MPTETLEEFIARRKQDPSIPSEVVESQEAIPVEAELATSKVIKPSQPAYNPGELTPEEKMYEEKLNSSNTSDSYIAAAIPAIAGMLTGFGSEGLKYGAAAGTKILDDRDNFTKKLIELRVKQKAKEKSSKLRPVNIEDPATGEIRIGAFDDATGQVRDTGNRTGYSLQRTIDPATKMVVEGSRSIPGFRQAISGTPSDTGTQNYSVRNQDIVSKAEEQVRKDPGYTKAKDQVLAAKQVGALLQSNGQISSKAVSSQLTLLFEGNQRMTDQDTVRYGLPRSWADRFNELIELGLSGKLSPDFKKELQDMTNVIAQRAASNGYQALNSKLSGIKNQYGIDAKERLSHLYDPFVGKFDPTKEVKKAKSEPMIDYPETRQKMYQGKMRTFEKTDAGWEMID